MNCRGLRQLSACCRHKYSLLTRKGPVLPESLRLKYEISKRSFIKEADSNCISPLTIKQALVDLNMKTESGHACIITQCPKVGRTAQSSRPDRLYINMTSGHFACEHCNKQGAWPVLMDNLKLLKTQEDRLGFTCFKDLENVRPILQDVSLGRELLSSCIPFGSLQEEDANKLKTTFGLELLKTETLDRFGVRCDLHNNFVVFPVIANGCVHSVKKITCHSHSDEVTGTLKETYIPRSDVTGVFGLDSVAPSVTDIVLTRSEADAMAVVQETNTAAVALPHGCLSLPQEVLPSLERFKTITFWFCKNLQDWESAKMLSQKLGSKRCHVIRPGMDNLRPMAALTQGLNLTTILSKAQPISKDSVLAFNIKEALFVNSQFDRGVKWKCFPILNKLLKGHQQRELTVVTGPTGSGKTTFVSQYSLDLCMQGVKTLWGSFENNNESVYEMMLTQFTQQKLAKNTELSGVYADLFQNLPMYFMTLHGQKGIKNVVNTMKHAVYVHDIAHVVLDNLQQFMKVAGDTERKDCLMTQDSIITVLKTFAHDMNCHVTLVIPPFKENEDPRKRKMFRSYRTTQTVNNVLILQDQLATSDLTSVRDRKYLEITQNMFDWDLGHTMLKFDPESLSFAQFEGIITNNHTN